MKYASFNRLESFVKITGRVAVIYQPILNNSNRYLFGYMVVEPWERGSWDFDILLEY